MQDDRVASPRRMRFGLADLEVHATRERAGVAAARVAADALKHLAARHDVVPVIFATGSSQLATLEGLTAMKDLPWDRVEAFHMDEYIGIGTEHPASFRRYLRENLAAKVPLRAFHEIDGSAADPDGVAAEYAQRVREANPQLCLLGIGENGHLAFNDPHVADFDDPLDARVVQLDEMCRQQQVAEGWFGRLEEVPRRAITLTIPALMRVPRLIASVPGERKAGIVRRAMLEPVGVDCPATILRTRAGVTVFLDEESAAGLGKE